MWSACCAGVVHAVVAAAKRIGANGTTIRRAARIRAIAMAIGLGRADARTADQTMAIGWAPKAVLATREMRRLLMLATTVQTVRRSHALATRSNRYKCARQRGPRTMASQITTTSRIGRFSGEAYGRLSLPCA